MSPTIGQRRIFIPLFLIIFIDSMGYGLLIPVLLRILMNSQSEFSSASQMTPAMRNFIFGVGVALPALTYLLAAPIFGKWSDKWGRRNTLLVSLIGSLVGFLIQVLGIVVSSLTLVFVGRGLAGAASSSQPIAQAAVADISAGHQKAFYLSMIAFAMTLAMVAGPLLGGYLSDPQLVSWFNNTTPFIVASLLVFINIVLLLLFFPETNPQITRGLLTFRETFQALGTIVSDKRVRVLLLVFFLYEFAWSLYFQDISLYLTLTKHYSADKIALFIAYLGAWMSLGLTLIYGKIIRYISLNTCLIGCLLIGGLGLLGCSLDNIQNAQWIFGIPVAITVGMAYPTLLALMSNRTGQEHQGWVMGAAGSMLGLSWMLSGFLSGPLTNISLQLPLHLAAVSMLLSLGILCIWLYVLRHKIPVSDIG